MSGIRWLVSYPRSGNTWTRLALWTIKYRRPAQLSQLLNFAQMAVSRRLLDSVLESDSSLLTKSEIEALRPDLHASLAPAEPVVKVHDAWNLTAEGAPVHDAAVTHSTTYLIRDPRDVAISWAKFRGRTIDWAIDWLADPEAMLDGRDDRIAQQIPQHVGSWSRNATSWIDDSGLAPLVVRYEDLIADMPHWLGAIARHLDWPADDDVIAMAVESTRFDALAKQEAQDGFSPRPRTADVFFRQGRAQGWRDTLSAEQAARIARDHGEVMARFGYLD